MADQGDWAPTTNKPDSLTAPPKFLKDQLFSDAIIAYGTQTYPVHRVVLCRRSDYFNKAFSSSFKGLEAKIEIDANDTSLQTLNCVLEHCYTTFDNQTRTRSYNLTRSSDEINPVFHAEVYGAADFFGCTLLKEEAKKRFSGMLALTNPKSKKLLLPIAKAVYSLTPASDLGLREVFMHYLFLHNLEDSLNENTTLKKLLSDSALQTFVSLSKNGRLTCAPSLCNPKKRVKYHCRGCHNTMSLEDVDKICNECGEDCFEVPADDSNPCPNLN